MPSRLEIAWILANDAELALKEYTAAISDFDEAVIDLKTTLRTEGELRLRNAGQRRHKASQAVTRTLKRQEDFARTGVVPDELKDGN